MKLNIVNIGLVSLILLKTATVAIGANRPADFGQQWVRSHPFTIMALTLKNESVNDNDRYSQAGLGTMLAWKNRPEIFKAAVRQKIPWHYHIDKRAKQFDDNLKSQIDNLTRTYPGRQGFLVWDEPKLPQMPAAGEMVAGLKQAYPDALVYSNINPVSPCHEYSMPNLAGEAVIGEGLYDEPPIPYTYDDHLDNLVRIVKPDVLMGDVYPFWEPEKTNPESYLRDKYFFMLMAFRKAGLKHHLPYWVFIQAYEDRGRCRYPSESDVRMQVYSSLAFGFTGLAYFTYDGSLADGRSILNQDFTPAPLYQDIKTLNGEVAHLGKTLRFLTSTDMRYLPGNHMESGKPVSNPVPRALVAFDSRSRVAKDVRSVTFGGTGSCNNGLLGFFRDDSDGKYFMIVNLQHGKNQTAAEQTAQITLTFNPSVKTVYRFSPQTGKVEPAPMKEGKLELRLPGGTGSLFKLNDNRFPGLVQHGN